MSRSIFVSLFALVALASTGLADEKVVALIESIKPSIVSVETNDGVSGSGFVYSQEKVVTNRHVIDGTSEVVVRFHNGEKRNAEGVVYVDRTRDIAILRIPSVADDVMPRRTATAAKHSGSE